MEDNDLYIICKKNPLNPDSAEEIYRMALNDSIEPFKSRGICASEFNFAV